MSPFTRSTGRWPARERVVARIGVTTVLVCANTTTAAAAADYRHLHYNQGPGGTSATANPEDRDTTLANNHPSNDVSLTIGSGVVFTAGGGVDMRLVEVDGAIALWRGGTKTVLVEDGAVINYERRPGGGEGVYDFWTHWLLNHAGIFAASETGEGGVTVRHHGVINLDIRHGTLLLGHLLRSHHRRRHRRASVG